MGTFFTEFWEYFVGFPRDVENMGRAPQNLIEGGGGLMSKHRGSTGQLKMLFKNTCEGVQLIVKLPAISLQASKFTKN